MSLTYLIDGYNLLHAMGAMRAVMAPTGLEKARLRLLGLLRNVLGDDASAVTVVFDAASAPPDVGDEQTHRGVHVRFAVHHAEADDLIEELIRQASAPKQLTLISDDRRLQRAARRRHCRVQGCHDFLDWLERQSHKRPPPQAEIPEKISGTNPREMKHWLEEFADLDQAKEMKELFDPFDFK